MKGTKSHYDVVKFFLHRFKATLWFRPQSGCFRSKPTQEEDSNYYYHGDKSGGIKKGFGYEELRNKGTAYSGQLTNSDEYTGWGHLWAEYNPLYIGLFKKNKLEGHGIRITHSSEETKSFSLGFWELGRISGSGILLQDGWTMIGDFKFVQERDYSVKHIHEDNKSFLQSLTTKKIKNIITNN